jgi:hypothetical protein
MEVWPARRVGSAWWHHEGAASAVEPCGRPVQLLGGQGLEEGILVSAMRALLALWSAVEVWATLRGGPPPSAAHQYYKHIQWVSMSTVGERCDVAAGSLSFDMHWKCKHRCGSTVGSPPTPPAQQSAAE